MNNKHDILKTDRTFCGLGAAAAVKVAMSVVTARPAKCSNKQ